MTYNINQQVASDISGYEGLQEKGAKNDWYYEDNFGNEQTWQEKHQTIFDMMSDLTGGAVLYKDVIKVFEWLENSGGMSQDDRYHSFFGL